MKIAMMLAIHNKPDQANVFIRQCLTDLDCHVFIHIDRKGRHIEKDLIKDSRVHVLPKSFSVEWGEFNQIRYVLYMMKYIRKFGSFEYYSIHSGSDLLVQPMAALQVYLQETCKYAYLDCHHLPWDQWQYGGGMGRLRLVWPRWMRRRLPQYSVRRYMRAVYGRMYIFPFLRLRKLPAGIDFYGKSAWYTLSEECVKDLLQFVHDRQDVLKFFRTVLCGDEIFFDTAVMYMAQKKGITDRVVRYNNLLFDDLFYGDGKQVGAAKTITVRDIQAIRESGAFFARKADTETDREVVAYYEGITNHKGY